MMIWYFILGFFFSWIAEGFTLAFIGWREHLWQLRDDRKRKSEEKNDGVVV